METTGHQGLPLRNMLFKIFPGAQVGRHQLRLRQCSLTGGVVVQLVSAYTADSGKILRVRTARSARARRRGGRWRIAACDARADGSDAWKAAVHHGTLQSIDILVGSGLHSVRGAKQRTVGRVARVHVLEPLA